MAGKGSCLGLVGELFGGGVWSDWRPPWSVWGLFECVFAHFRGGVGVWVSGLGRVGGLSGWGLVGLRRGGGVGSVGVASGRSSC